MAEDYGYDDNGGTQYYSNYYMSGGSDGSAAGLKSNGSSNNFIVMIASICAAFAGILSLAGVIFMMHSPPTNDDEAIEMPYLAPDYGDFEGDNVSDYYSETA